MVGVTSSRSPGCIHRTVRLSVYRLVFSSPGQGGWQIHGPALSVREGVGLDAEDISEQLGGDDVLGPALPGDAAALQHGDSVGVLQGRG